MTKHDPAKKTMQSLANETVNNDTTVGALLYRIAYWHERAKIRKHGRLWAVRSRDQFYQDCGLTPDQYRRALALLKKKRLVETCRGLIGGKNLTHVRLMPAALKALRMEPRPRVQKGAAALVQTGDTPPVQTGAAALVHINTEKITTEKINTGKGELALAALESLEENEIQETKTMPPKPKPKLLAHEITKPTRHQKLTGPCTASQMGAVWQDTMNEVYGDYTPPFTAKQLGQLKHIVKAAPEGKAGEILQAVIRNWSTFITKAEQHGTAFKSPAKPHLGYVVQHFTIALNFKASSSGPAVVYPTGHKPEIVAVPKKAAEPSATKEEIQAILGDLLKDML